VEHGHFPFGAHPDSPDEINTPSSNLPVGSSLDDRIAGGVRILCKAASGNSIEVNRMNLSQRACLALVICLPALAAPEQTPAQAAATLATSEGRIHLDVMVTDKPGQPVSGLVADDFSLLDNNQPGKILSFHVNDATALSELIIVIDQVNVMADEDVLIHEGVEKFLRQNGGHLAQPVVLLNLTEKGLNLLSQSFLDGNALADQVHKLPPASLLQLSNTNTYRYKNGSIMGAGITTATNGWEQSQRVAFSVNALDSIVQGEGKKPGKKLLIWASRGWPLLYWPNIEINDKAHQYYFNEVVGLSAKLREARISVYSIVAGVGVEDFHFMDFVKVPKKPLDTQPAHLDLRLLAIQSGGRVVPPSNDLAAQINGCIQDAGNIYSLSFDPPSTKSANEYHTLKVQIGKPGLTALTNTGYFAQP
jgi:VWFA-related protein